MVNLNAIPLRRSFLPPTIILNPNSGRGTAELATIPDCGRAHKDVVSRLDVLSVEKIPVVSLRPDGLTTVVPATDDRDQSRAMRELGYALDRRRDLLVRVHEQCSLADDLNGLYAIGYGLDRAAWEVAGADRRTLAWSHEAYADDGLWAQRAIAGEAQAFELQCELRRAIRMAERRSVHITPLLDGSLRTRMQPVENDSLVHPWEAHEGGCGMLVIRRDFRRLVAYATSDSWLAWFLQRVLLDAWADESLGENVSWHWGV